MTRRRAWAVHCTSATLALGTPATASHAMELELVLRGGPFIPTRPEGSLSRAGIEGGGLVLLRLGEHFAFGGTLDTAWIGWNARGSSDGVVVEGSGFPEPDGSVQSTLHALAMRWYPVTFEDWSPYLDLDVGYVSVLEIPDHPNCGDGSGVSGRLGFGLDWALSSWARVGGAFGVRPLRMGRGCDGIAYGGKPPSPPSGGFALSGQVAFTTVWSSE